MAFQPVPDGIEVVFNAVQNSVPIVNVYHVKADDDLTEEYLTSIGDIFVSWWHANIQIILSNSYVLNNVTVTALEESTGPQVIIPLTTGNQGALTGEQVAGNAAVVASWRTASIGRSFRGRTYFGGLDAAATDTAQTVTAPFAAAIADAGVALIEALSDFGAFLSVLSRVAGGVLRVSGLLTQIVAVIVDLKLDSQRRRTAN